MGHACCQTSTPKKAVNFDFIRPKPPRTGGSQYADMASPGQAPPFRWSDELRPTPCARAYNAPDRFVVWCARLSPKPVLHPSMTKRHPISNKCSTHSLVYRYTVSNERGPYGARALSPQIHIIVLRQTIGDVPENRQTAKARIKYSYR